MAVADKERERVKRLYGCDDPVDSYIVELGFRIENTTSSKIRALYPEKRHNDGPQGAPSPPRRPSSSASPSR